jgi:hypothetical protein
MVLSRLAAEATASWQRMIAMGWTPPHTYGIECQTGAVKLPVTE